VLSVWKLGHGQETYYLEAVAKGVEDYYVGGEAPGRWIGSGGKALGLVGEVDANDLHAVLSGRDPSTGTRLGQAHRVPGFDLTFRAPKSVSVLFGLGDPGVSRQVRDAHDHALEVALDFAERHVVWSRRGHGGTEQVRGEGLIAAAFRHRTSRNGDPHLHTHVLVANMVRGEDGRWATLDARWIYTWAKTIGYVYEAQLRHNLTVALGVEWGAVSKGIADIAHIPAAVLKGFSSRRAEIEERMAIRNQHSARAAMYAALDTRQAKQPDPDVVDLRTRWARHAREMGYDPAQLRDALGRAEPAELTDAERVAVEDRLLGPDGLTRNESSFDRRDIIQAWCDSLPAGAPVEHIEELVELLIDRHQTAPLHNVAPVAGPAIRDVAGRSISALPPQERWTTFELLETERRALATARSLLGAERAVCSEDVVLAALRDAPRLSDEQVRAVVQMTRSGNGLDVLTAPGGAGKTYAFAAAREAWERAGYRVIGAAHTGIAADELSRAGGIPSTTIARLRIALDGDEPGGLDGRTVLVVDEAGTAGTRDLARLLDEVAEKSAKVVLSGDPKQLPEIAAGGLFAALTQQQPAIELRDNHRQQHEWEVDALRQLRDGNTTAALHAYLDHDRITVGYDAANTKGLLVGDWWAAYVAGDDAVMLAGRRADVAELNMCGHVRADDAGMLSGPTLHVAGVPIQAGDKVMMLRNDRRLHVSNGNRGHVESVDPDERTMRVRLARGVVDVPARYVDAGHVGLAYAMTVNKAHGTTCDETMTLADDLLYRELAYEAMSRGRHDNHIYMSRSTVADLELGFEDGPHAPIQPGQDPLDVLAAGFERRHAKQLALDGIANVPLEGWSTADLLAECDRIHAVLREAPPDRAADLAALVAARREAEAAVRARRSEVAELEGRTRPWRERRQPDHELTRAQHRLGESEQRLDGIVRQIGGLEESQHRRASFLAAHDADRVELAEVDHVLDKRLQTQIARVVKDPPSYIAKSLGPRPAVGEADRAWVKAVIEIETYRQDNNITDRRTTLGPEPPTRHIFGQHEWHRVNWAIEDAKDTIFPAMQPVGRPGPELTGPSLDIDL
jgi:conjugative relaxase-like TrwC/TraI family protein